jgi:hypothetical protein
MTIHITLTQQCLCQYMHTHSQDCTRAHAHAHTPLTAKHELLISCCKKLQGFETE